MPKTVFNREQLKTEFPQIIAFIQKTHVMEDWVYKELYENPKYTPQRGLSTTQGSFVVAFEKFYIHYLMEHIIENVELHLIGRSVREVTIFDTKMEYDLELQRALANPDWKHKQGTPLN